MKRSRGLAGGSVTGRDAARAGWPGPVGASLGEGLAAAAGALRVRVVDGEPGALEPVLEVERRARQQLGAGRVDEHLHLGLATEAQLDVVAGDLAVEEHLVAEAGAAA